MSADRPIVIVSNRGPLAFSRHPDGHLTARRGAGGLVSGLAPIVSGTDAVWVAAALTEADRDAAAAGLVEDGGLRVRMVAPDPEDLRLAYDVVCNQTFWFAHHGLFDRYREPTFDAGWYEAWAAYRRVNERFAECVAETAPRGAAVLIQDYHLTLVARVLRTTRPDLACVHFSHTPFAHPSELEVLPPAVRAEMLEGLAAHRACGFHSQRWAGAARDCARAAGFDLTSFVAPLGPDPDDLAATVRSPECGSALADLDRTVGDRRFLVRVDRIELSKNILRGFLAYDHFLATRPEWRERVVFGALVYPSREGVETYRRYREDVEAAVDGINQRWATPDWQPVVYDSTDDYPRSVAALRRADVVMVNPVRDGLNLVAKESVLLSGRDAVLLLSEGAGAWDELGASAVRIDAYDTVQGAGAIAEALDMDATERAARASDLRRRVAQRTPSTWLADQLAHA